MDQHGTGSRRSIWIAAGVLVALLGMAAAWRWTPLADQIDIGKVTAWASALRSNPSRVMIILGAYLIGTIISLPITILILATALVFGADKRNHLFVHRMYDRLSGDIRKAIFLAAISSQNAPELNGKRWNARSTGREFWRWAALRAIPIAPFTVVNIISGAFQLPVRDYVVGSLLGLAPGIIITNLFAHQLPSAIRNPRLGSFVVLAVCVIISILGTIWLRRKFTSKD